MHINYLLITQRETFMQRKGFIAVAAVILAAVVIAAFLNIKLYIGADTPQIKAYTMNEEGELDYSVSIPRGLSVSRTGAKADLDGHEMTEVKIPAEAAKAAVGATDAATDTASDISAADDATTDNTNDAEINRLFYIDSKNIVKSKDDIVQETELYVRTALTIYKEPDIPDIESYVAKGEHLDILETGELQEDGSIDMYKVAYTDASGKSGEGYAYGKYLVGNAEAVTENYNAHGEYKAAKKAEYGFDLGGGHARNMDYFPVNKPSFDDKELCRDARTMYINTAAAINYKPYVDLIESTDCNAVVIDIKDGPLTYKSDVAKEYSPTSYKKAYSSVEKFREGVEAYKSTGVYTIGRIVVFNDSRYAKDHPEDCINGDSWPSAYSRRVWEYNVKLAIEAVELFGFDEIQFDYVRFPESSYEMSQNKKTDWKSVYGEEKGQAIQGFCFYACDQIHKAGAYVSVDVFGECSYTYCTAYGQYWPAISNVVDAISSMPYSDHHGDKNDTWTNPYSTLNAWAKRTAQRQKECSTPAVDRTWITGYNTPYWNPTVTYDEKKMKEQIKALTDAGLNGGFIPWNVLSDIDKYKQYKGIWNTRK